MYYCTTTVAIFDRKQIEDSTMIIPKDLGNIQQNIGNNATKIAHL